MRIYLILIMIFISNPVFPQGVNNIWLLGYNTGTDQYTTSQKATIDFSGGVPFITPTIRKMKFAETQGNISDSNGNLLMSSNGIWIANANGDTMMNGGGINPGQFANNHQYGSSIGYGNLFLPWPGDTSKYVLFHQTGNYNFNLLSSELFYSVIDKNLDNGLGAVILKNQIIVQDILSWGIGACKHANGRDWWIIALKDGTDQVYKLLLTPNGISSISQQSLGVPAHLYCGTQPCFSPDGTKFAYTYSITDPFGGANWIFNARIFNFDRCTGLINNPHVINLTDSSIGTGIAFSPNSQYVYAATIKHVYQIETNTSFAVDTVATYDGFQSALSPSIFFLMYLAKDNKIYISAGNYGVDVHYINYPDSSGLSCDVQQHALHIPCYNFRTVPNHPNYFLGPVIGSICDTLNIGINEVNHDFEFVILPNPSNGDFNISYFLPQNKGGVFEIFDLEGRKVVSQSLPPWSSFQKINLPDRMNGFFQCVIKSGNFRCSKKLVVVK